LLLVRSSVVYFPVSPPPTVLHGRSFDEFVGKFLVSEMVLVHGNLFLLGDAHEWTRDFSGSFAATKSHCPDIAFWPKWPSSKMTRPSGPSA